VGDKKKSAVTQPVCVNSCKCNWYQKKKEEEEIKTTEN
jgi:hypothetical protein